MIGICCVHVLKYSDCIPYFVVRKIYSQAWQRQGDWRMRRCSATQWAKGQFGRYETLSKSAMDVHTFNSSRSLWAQGQPHFYIIVSRGYPGRPSLKSQPKKNQDSWGQRGGNSADWMVVSAAWRGEGGKGRWSWQGRQMPFTQEKYIQDVRCTMWWLQLIVLGSVLSRFKVLSP